MTSITERFDCAVFPSFAVSKYTSSQQVYPSPKCSTWGPITCKPQNGKDNPAEKHSYVNEHASTEEFLRHQHREKIQTPHRKTSGSDMTILTTTQCVLDPLSLHTLIHTPTIYSLRSKYTPKNQRTWITYIPFLWIQPFLYVLVHQPASKIFSPNKFPNDLQMAPRCPDLRVLIQCSVKSYDSRLKKKNCRLEDKQSEILILVNC